jgi:hypothetical protein
MSRKEDTPFFLKWEENQKGPTQNEAKEKLANSVNKEPNHKEFKSSKRRKRNPTVRNEDFLWITE